MIGAEVEPVTNHLIAGQCFGQAHAHSGSTKSWPLRTLRPGLSVLCTQIRPIHMSYNAYIQRASAKSDIPKRLAATGAALPQGAPFLVSRTTGQPITPILQFLRDTCIATRRGRTKRVSVHTYEAMVSDLKDFVDAMDAYDVMLMEAHAVDLDRYVDSMIYEPSPVTQQKYADRTIKRRMSTIRSFYQWAQEHGLTKHKFEFGAMRPGRRTNLPDAKIAPDVWEPDGVDQDTDVTAIGLQDLRNIMSALGPLPKISAIQPPEEEATAVEMTFARRLMFECCLQSGLRRSEVVWLRVDKVEEASSKMQEPLYKYPLEVFGKGRKWRRVMTPGWLLAAIREYIANERHEIIKRRRELDLSFEDHGRVFVRACGGTKSRGNALRPKSMNAKFSRALKSIGITRRSGEGRMRAKYGPHALRHTYAVIEYWIRKSEGDAEPWHYIQRQLGHSSVETTQRIYLRVVHENEIEAGTLLDAMLQRLVLKNG